MTGLVMMVGALGWTAGSSYAGKHGRPETGDGLLRAGAVALLGGSVISLALVPIDHLPVTAAAVATVGFTVMAIGMGLATPLMSTLALDLAPAGRQGESGAAIQMSDALVSLARSSQDKSCSQCVHRKAAARRQTGRLSSVANAARCVLGARVMPRTSGVGH